MNALIKYLIDHIVLDFDGELDLVQVREFLHQDQSRDARTLLAKLIEIRGVDDMMITLADCLKENLETGINPEVVREQLRTYAES